MGWGGMGLLRHTQGLVRVGSGLSSILWATVGHRPGSWSSHLARCGWPRLFFSASRLSYRSSSPWHHPSKSCGSTHGHGLWCRSLGLHASPPACALRVSPWASSWSPQCRFDGILYMEPCRLLLSSYPPEWGSGLASGSAWGSFAGLKTALTPRGVHIPFRQLVVYSCSYAMPYTLDKLAVYVRG